MRDYQIIILVASILVFAYLAAFSFVFSHVLDFRRNLNRRELALAIIESEQVNTLASIDELFKSEGVSYTAEEAALLSSLSSLAFDKPTHDLVIESQERIKQAKSALSYLALSNKWAEKAERYQGLVGVYADLERFYRQNVALYNSDVEAYNYWRSIPGYRPIFHILGFKSRPGI